STSLACRAVPSRSWVKRFYVTGGSRVLTTALRLHSPRSLALRNPLLNLIFGEELWQPGNNSYGIPSMAQTLPLIEDRRYPRYLFAGTIYAYQEADCPLCPSSKVCASTRDAGRPLRPSRARRRNRLCHRMLPD